MIAPFRPNTKHANIESGKYDARDMFEGVVSGDASCLSPQENEIFKDYFFVSASLSTLSVQTQN
jgi:hypothetical protein